MVTVIIIFLGGRGIGGRKGRSVTPPLPPLLLLFYSDYERKQTTTRRKVRGRIQRRMRK